METICREACRAIILNPEKEILLIKVSDPIDGWTGWITPGGGMEIGESQEAVLRRELYEELGLTEFDMGPHVWTRSHEFSWSGTHFAQKDHFFYLEVDKFHPKPQQLMEEENFLELRWWSLEEIRKTSDSFAPRDIYRYTKDIFELGPPRSPIDVGI